MTILNEIPVMDLDDVPLNLVTAESRVTTLALSPLLLGVGLDNGSLIFFDTDTYKPFPTKVPQFKSRVVSISIDSSSAAIAAASLHGEVLIVENMLLLSSSNASVNVLENLDIAHCPVNAVAICPDYSSSSAYRRVVVAGATGDLIVLSQQGAPFPSKSLSKSGPAPGPVTSLVWQKDHLVWAGPEIGLKALNTSTGRKIVSIPSHGSKGVRLSGSGEMFVAWSGYIVTVFRIIVENNVGEVCQVLRQVELPADEFAPDSEIGDLMGPNRHRIVSVEVFDPSELSLSLITTSLGKMYFHLVDTNVKDIPISDLLCDSVSGTDLVVANGIIAIGTAKIVRFRKRSVMDNALWLINREHFEEALSLSALNPSIKNFVANKALAPLLASGQFERAAAFLTDRLDLDSAEKWSKIIDVFIALPIGIGLKKSLELLIPLLPVPPRDSFALNTPQDYDRIVDSLMRNIEFSAFTLLDTVRRWPAILYSACIVKDRLIDLIPEDFTLSKGEKNEFIPKSAALFPPQNLIRGDKCKTIAQMLALQCIFENLSRHSDSMDILIRLNCVTEVFVALNQWVKSDSSVRSWFEVNMLSLFQLDSTRSANFLLQNDVLFPYDFVVGELSPHPFFLHVFWRELFFANPDSTKQVQNEQVFLFSQYDPELLVPFLRSASHYDCQTALDFVSKQRPRLVKAEALLLFKSNRSKDAISLLLADSGDIETAVCVASDSNDPDLWVWLRSQIKKSEESNLGTKFLHSLLETSRLSSSSSVTFPSPGKVLLETCDSPGIAVVAEKILDLDTLTLRIESACARLLKSEWEDRHRPDMHFPTGGVTFIDPLTDLCRVCGLKIACIPPGVYSHSSFTANSEYSPLALFKGYGDRVHSKCLSRTGVGGDTSG